LGALFRRVKGNQKGLKLNGTQHIFTYADDVNIVGENTDNKKKNTAALLDDSIWVGLEVNLEKTKYISMSRSQNIGQKYSIKMGNRSFQDMKFKCLGTTLTEQNCMHEQIKSFVNSGYACYHSVQSLLSSRLLSRNLKVTTHKTTVLPVVLYGCETLSLTFREQHRLRVFETRVLRRKFGPKNYKVMGKWRKLRSGELHNLYSSPDIIRRIKSSRIICVGHMARMGEERKLCMFSVGKPEGKCPLRKPRCR
jgi:hypothetical protein